MKTNNRLLRTGATIGVCLGALAGLLFPVNLLQYWKSLDYFPYPVTQIIDVSGYEISVETQTGEFYILDRRCKQEPCWRGVDFPEVLFDRSSHDPYYDLQINKTCRFEHFVYPLLRRIKMCAGTNYPVMDTTEWVYAALTENGEVWVWHGGFIIPPAGFIVPLIFALFGAVPGVVLGYLLIIVRKLREKDHQPPK